MTDHNLTVNPTITDCGIERHCGVCGCGKWRSESRTLKSSVTRDHQKHLEESGVVSYVSYLRKVVLGW